MLYTVPLPGTPFHMQEPAKKKALDAVRRLEGLTGKLHTMIDDDAYCVRILEIVLAMQGHLKHIQGTVLESHLHTCAKKRLGSKDKHAFILELINVIGLSKRS